MERWKFAIVVAVLVTLTLWLAGCNTIEHFTHGLHLDVKSYNDGVAEARKK